MDTYKRSIRGLQSRSNGEHFEGMIIAASRFYEERGIAAVDKTPEAFKVLKAMDRNRGQFICCFTKQAQPDFKGILMDSTMILFDAKHTDKDKISRDVVTAEQQACFERYMKLGAMCFLVVSLEFKEFYRVPWVVFRDMKKIYGHKYMNREELADYLGVTRPSLSRTMMELQKMGLIKVDGRKVWIMDMEELGKIMEDE